MDNSTESAHTVIAMSDYQQDNRFAPIAQIEAYWEAVRGARLLPKRSDIDPRGIEQSLEHAFILERVAAGIARMRIAGSHLNQVMGMEVRGMPLTSFFTPAARATVSDLLEVVFQTPAICTLHLTSAEAIGRPPLQGRLIMLPLKSDLGDVSRVLGCLVVSGDIGNAPRRFDIAHKDVLHIAAGEAPVLTTQPNMPPVARPQQETPQNLLRGMAEEQRSFEKAEAKRRPPYLRLVKTDED